MKKNTTMLVTSIEHLKKLCADQDRECFISLKWGGKSSKRINYSTRNHTFYIFNYIDDTEQELQSLQLMDTDVTNIGQAIINQCFFVERMRY